MIVSFLSLLLWLHEAHCAMEGFVVDGKKTAITNYPHSVYLNIICTKVTFICGASIVNQRVVLTAGHCLEDCNTKTRDEVYLKYGHEKPALMSTTKMRGFVIHPNYNPDNLENDIALVKGKRALPLGQLVRRVALMRFTPRNKFAYMAGWGVMNNQNQVALSLLDGAQEMQPPSVCKLIGALPRGSFCAGPIRGPGHPDRGDSGSALIVRGFVQIGLVSYKVDHYSLVVYTNVSYHYRWIRYAAKQLYCG